MLPLTAAIHDVFDRVWYRGQAIYSPDDTLATIWKLFPRLSGFKQQDVDEFLRKVVTQLETEWKAHSITAPLELWRHFQYDSGVSVTCSGCGNVSTTRTTFSCPVSVQVPAKFQSQSGSTSRSRRGEVCTLGGE